MPADEPITFAAGALASADLNAGRNTLRWVGGFSAGSKPSARVRSTSNVALSNSGDWSTLTFHSDTQQGETLLWSALAPTLFTFPVTGWYLVGACVRTEATTANKALRILLNGNDTIVQHDNIGVQTPAFTTMNVSCLYLFAANDTIQAQVFQDSGATINAVVEGFTPMMWATWVSKDGT